MATKSLLVWCLLHCVHTKPGYEPPYGERLQPKPFKYQYGLQGAGAAFTKKEVQDADGNIVGEVVVALPDGRIQTTQYNADFYDGYSADIKYAGTASYPPPKYQHEKYNSQSFLPVHLKSKPQGPALHQTPWKTIHTASPTYPRYETFPHRNKQILQPELKTAEITVESKQQSEIVFEPEKIESVNRPESSSAAEESRTKPKPEKLSISGLGESIEMAVKLREELESAKKIKESEKLILSPMKSKQQIFQNRPLTPQIKQEAETKNSGFPTLSPESEINKENSLVNQKESNSRLPSSKPETPQIMVIKSHTLNEPVEENGDLIKESFQHTTEISEMSKTESKVKQPMSIKSKVLSAPKPAESMEIIMKKIREDLTNKESNQARVPAVITKSKQTKNRKEKELPDFMQEIATATSAKSNVIEFMKKVELMKEKKAKSNQSDNDEEKGVANTSPTIGRY